MNDTPAVPQPDTGMDPFHKRACIVAALFAIAAIIAMLFGSNIPGTWISSKQSFREIAIAAWGVGLPGWFLFEDKWISSKYRNDAARLDAFRNGQEIARVGWSVVGIIIATIIGAQIVYKDVNVVGAQSTQQPGAADTKPD